MKYFEIQYEYKSHGDGDSWCDYDVTAAINKEAAYAIAGRPQGVECVNVYEISEEEYKRRMY